MPYEKETCPTRRAGSPPLRTGDGGMPRRRLASLDQGIGEILHKSAAAVEIFVYLPGDWLLLSSFG